MISEFKRRKPWAAFIIAAILGVPAGMCYLNRGKLALLYFALMTAIVLGFSVAIIFYSLPINLQSLDLVELVYLPYLIIGVAHCVYLATEHPESGPVKWFGRWYMLVLIFLIAPALFALTFRAFFYEPFYLPAASMSPTVNVDDYFFVQKFAYSQQAPQRGDIVSFKLAKLHNHTFIKRIIGLPGDKVQITNGVPIINGTPVTHKKIVETLPVGAIRTNETVSEFIETLPGGREHKILLNDKPATAENTSVYSVPEGHYFVLGDNRDNSNDSRFDQFGFIPQEAITGKAVETIFNFKVGRYDPKPIN